MVYCLLEQMLPPPIHPKCLSHLQPADHSEKPGRRKTPGLAPVLRNFVCECTGGEPFAWHRSMAGKLGERMKQDEVKATASVSFFHFCSPACPVPSASPPCGVLLFFFPNFMAFFFFFHQIFSSFTARASSFPKSSSPRGSVRVVLPDQGSWVLPAQHC